MNSVIYQVDSNLQTELNNTIKITSKTGSGVDLLYALSLLSKLQAGTNISINKIINAGQADDGQTKLDVYLSSYYDETFIDSTFFLS